MDFVPLSIWAVGFYFAILKEGEGRIGGAYSDSSVSMYILGCVIFLALGFICKFN